jgi:hypothetical protein
MELKKLDKSFLKEKNKRAEIFGMSFSMIFSIILIVFFIISAFIAIRTFLNYQKCSQIGLFVNDLKDKVDEAFNSDSSSFVFSAGLPSGVEYACFINASAEFPTNANNIEKNIFNFVKTYEPLNFKDNFYFYAPKKNYCIKWSNIKNVELAIHNPICFKVVNGKASIKIERQFDKPLVMVSEA